MKASIHTHLTKAIVPAALVAGLAAPAALAGNSYPDAVGRAVNVHNAASYPDAVGRAVNTHNAASYLDAFGRAVNVHNAASYPDAVGRAVNTHNAAWYPDAFRRAVNVRNTASYPDAFRRAVNTHNAAQLARSPVVTIVESGGFDWADAGIGAGGGIAFLLVLAAGGSMLLRGKARPIRA